MKYVFAILSLVVATPSFAATYMCRVNKSLLQYNPESGELKKRIAETALFEVTKSEHEDQKSLDLFEKDGSHWGKALVSTGSHTTETGESFYANAMITDFSGNIQAYLTLRMPKNSSDASASTMMLGEKLPPTLTLSCFFAVD